MQTRILFLMLLVTTCLFSTIINVPTDLPTIQDGIELAAESDTILVAEGTYYENIDFIGKAITVASNFIIDGDESHIENTIINGSQPEDPDYGSCVRFHSNEDTTSVLTGFTLTEGTGCFMTSANANVGGGIHCVGSSPKIVSNIVRENSAYFAGGIGTQNFSSPIILNNVISYNTGVGANAGMSIVFDSDPYLEGNIISHNTSNAHGGGMIIGANSNPTLVNNIISNNSASTDGGGIEIGDSTPIIINCTIYDNEAPGYGSQIDCWTGGLHAVNCIIGGNTTNGSVYFNTFTPTFDYCDFYNNDGPNFYGPFVPPTLGVISGTNANGDPCDEFMNILLEPLFVDPTNNDFHLSEGSPCIDAGDPSFPLDPFGTCVEIGCYCFDPTEINGNTVVPTTDYLHQNYPNPFNPTTTISFSTTESTENTELVIYNLKGQKIKDLSPSLCHAELVEVRGESRFSVVWNGDDDSGNPVSSGIYFYKLKTDNFEQSKKMILMK